jgi:UDP-N-acetylmuramate: L-alanyl-gamma-D-glutamyl-meso-diaminopimelate ligase
MRIYILGVCGTAMSHVALLAREMGHVVSGTDTSFFPPISTLLEASGVETFSGYSAERLDAIEPDCVVVGNVVSRLNPEVEFLLRTRKYPFVSFPEFLRQKVLFDRFTVTIAGTHGKTTTTSLLAFLLRENGIDAGYFVGGLPKNFPHGAARGHPEAPFVIEGDEYDTAFFDKKSKFHHYFPNLLIINNIEFDHGDIFSSLRDIQRAFYLLARTVPDNGCILYNGDDTNVRKLLPFPWTQAESVGFGRNNFWRLTDFRESIEESSFLLENGGRSRRIFSPLKGIFNTRNVAMAVVACHQLCPDKTVDYDVLRRFEGVERRQSTLLDTEHFKIVEDFAHHPTSVGETLKCLRAVYPGHRVVACFEPSCNTSASHHFARRGEEAFAAADHVLISPPKPHLFSDKFVSPLYPIDVDALVRTLARPNRPALAFETVDQLSLFLEHFDWWSIPTVLCFLSNGPLIHLTRAFAERVRSKS